MEGKEIKEQLHKIFGPQLKFNKEFDKYSEKLKEGMLSDFFAWCNDCKNDMADRSTPPIKKYKHLLVFFRKVASDVRVVLIKEKNSDFIEIILGGHKYYDDVRMKFGYKRSSYYDSQFIRCLLTLDEYETRVLTSWMMEKARRKHVK